MDEPTVPMGEPELWRVSDYRRGLTPGAGAPPVDPRLRAISPSLYADLAHGGDEGRPADLLEALAACLRHGCAATLQLEWDDHVLPLTLFPRERLVHAPLSGGQLWALPFERLRLIEVEPAALRPPGRPGGRSEPAGAAAPEPPRAPARPSGPPLTGPLGPDLLPLNPLDVDFELNLPLQPDAAPEQPPEAEPQATGADCQPLARLAWALARHGRREALLPGIAGPALYRCTPDSQLPGDAPPAWRDALRRLRDQPVSVETVAGWQGMDAALARRLLNGLYLQSGLIVSRSHVALTWSAWFGALLGPAER